MSTVTSVAGSKFTDEILARNFSSISQAFFEFEKWSEVVDKQLAEALKLASKKPSKIKPFLVGAAVGIAVYSYAKKNSQKVESVVKTANDKASAVYQDVVIGRGGAQESGV